jgi:Spy/CpxP family protein refolding chaperone
MLFHKFLNHSPALRVLTSRVSTSNMRSFSNTFRSNQMFTRTKFSSLILIIAAALFGGTAFAQQPQQNNSGVAPTRPNRQMRQVKMRRRGIARGFHQLNLTDQQRQQMRSIMQSQAQSTQTQRRELRQLAQKHRTAPLTDAETARAKELRQQLMQSRQGVHTQMLAVLTPEQKAKLDEMVKNRRANRAKPGPGRRII